MKSTKRKLSKIADKLSTPAARFYAFVAFFVIVFFTGGGSRDDIQSLLLLRPLAVLFCAYALTVMTPEQWQGRMFPLYIAGALLALMVVQLIPLPPSVWTSLPGRQIFADIANLAGIEQPWRPLTLSPSKTLNSIFAMSVPVAAMMLYLNLEPGHRMQSVAVVICLILFSALWSIFQLVGPPRGPLYTYHITNFGYGVGLFANRNHQAVVLASAISMLGWYVASQKNSARLSWLKFFSGITAIAVAIPLILVIGSRAGLLLMFPALIIAIISIYFGSQKINLGTSRYQTDRDKRQVFSVRNIALGGGLVAILVLAFASVSLSRSMALDRLIGNIDMNELRFQLIPTLFAMIKDYMPWGSGFGSFEHVYKIYEPQALLNPSYLNQAHNDWLQYVIEGGIPALLIAICAMIWMVKCIYLLISKWRVSRSLKYFNLMCLSVLLFILAASVGDYPLRTPSIAAIFTLFICLFSDGLRLIKRREMLQC